METELNNSALTAYLSDTISLARSLVIKSEISASVINNRLVKTRGEAAVDFERPRTWKYYLNISGKYHWSDTMMKVISLDTREEIEFTVENLEEHTATAKAYKYGTRYYYTLARKYPRQVPLILSILNPVDRDTAIDAEDGTILAWDRSLVEIQEDTLLYELEQYIKNFLSRNTVIGYNRTWSYYPGMVVASLYMSLTGKIMNLRLRNCKTERAHTFHMRQYLASHGYLDRFIPYLNLDQMLYLYMNIDRLEKHAGKTETFYELIYWILVIRRIPLSDYTVRQLIEFDSGLMPILIAHRTSLGTSDNSAAAEYVDLKTFFEKEVLTQNGNERYYENHLKRITHDLQTSPSSVVLTKDLESAMVDYTNAVPDPLPDVLMRQWAYMACNDLYNVVVNFSNPATGVSYTLLAKDALIYYSYITLRAHDIPVEDVPSFLNVKFKRNPRIALEELTSEIPDQFPWLYDTAKKLRNAGPNITRVTSVTQFWEMTYAIYQESMDQWFLKGATHDPLARGVVGKMINRLYGIELIELEKNMTMKQWLTANNLPEYDLKREEALLMTREIFENATGFAVDDTKTLKAIQKALLELFGQLSSYAIQFMREINDSDIIPLSGAQIRIGVESQESYDGADLYAPVRVLDATQYSSDAARLEDESVRTVSDLDQMVHEVFIKAPVEINLFGVNQINHGVDMPAVRIYDPEEIGQDPQKSRFLPMRYYNALSQEQIADIANQFL